MRILRQPRWYAVPLGIFVVTRAVDVLLIVLLARHQIPASALPADMPLPTLVDPSSYLHVIANWDGQWYRQIAGHGYPSHLPTQHGVVQQNAWAFYPGYPALVRLVMLTGASFGVAASTVSLLAGAAAMCLLHRMLEPRCGRFTAGLTVLALCSAPAAPIFQAAYSESLALLLVVSALWSLEHRRYGLLVLAGLGLSLTRAITAPLALVVLLQLLLRWRRRAEEPFPVRERWQLAGSAVAVLGFALVWPAVTAVVTGVPDAYRQTQTAWATVAGNRPDSWLHSLVDGAGPGRWIVVIGLVALLSLIAVRARRWPWGARVWTVVYPVFILGVTPATASGFRFMLLAVTPWWPAPEAGDRIRSRGARVAVVLAVLVVGILLQWWWLRSYFVIDPASKGHP